MAMPMPSTIEARKSTSLNGAISAEATTVTRTAMMQPPARPSMVLLGLAADSGVRPALRPIRKPPAS
jgi:hypothetical protein